MLDSNYTRFADMKEGVRYSQPALVISMEDNVARTGKKYVKFRLADGVGTIQANIFDATVSSMRQKGITEGVVAQIDVTVKKPYYNVSGIILNPDPGVSTDDFICTAPGDPVEMYYKIYNSIFDSLSCHDEGDANLWIVVDDILANYQDGYMYSSAAKTIHHACKSGLLYHSYRMTMAAVDLLKTYTNLDKALLTAGAALHDIGKLQELETNEFGEAAYTVKGRLFGHAILGVQMIDEAAERLGCQCEKIEMLKHIIASHHGKNEYGACTVPAIPEALCVNMLDTLDAKMYQLEEALETSDPGELTKKVFGLENHTAYRMSRSVEGAA